MGQQASKSYYTWSPRPDEPMHHGSTRRYHQSSGIKRTGYLYNQSLIRMIYTVQFFTIQIPCNYNYRKVSEYHGSREVFCKMLRSIISWREDYCLFYPWRGDWIVCSTQGENVVLCVLSWQRFH